MIDTLNLLPGGSAGTRTHWSRGATSKGCTDDHTGAVPASGSVPMVRVTSTHRVPSWLSVPRTWLAPRPMRRMSMAIVAGPGSGAPR